MKRQPSSGFLIFLLIFTYLCSLFDLWYTLYAVEYIGAAREVNPVFALLLQNPLLAVLYKYAVLPLALYLLYRFRRFGVARFGIYLCALCFGLTVAYQLLMIPRWSV